MDTIELLKAVAAGEKSPEEALLELKIEPFKQIRDRESDFARFDSHRKIRQGYQEVIFGEAKTAAQINEILRQMVADGLHNILVTRLSREKADELEKNFIMNYDAQCRMAVVEPKPEPICKKGYILVVTAGTGDIPIAQEAALTAEVLGNEVKRLYDVGVAGLHRLLSNLPIIMKARVIVVVAGMEGALASVVGGLADCPVIAVPTSVGYGANLQGIAALLSMLNSCSGGVSTVNIDNGFGAGYLASMINKM